MQNQRQIKKPLNNQRIWLFVKKMNEKNLQIIVRIISMLVAFRSIGVSLGVLANLEQG